MIRLEEEKVAFQERTSYIEDLHHNDKELLQVLRKQLESLDIDLNTAKERNRDLQESLKLAEVTRNEHIKEQVCYNTRTCEPPQVPDTLQQEFLQNKHFFNHFSKVKLHKCLGGTSWGSKMVPK